MRGTCVSALRIRGEGGDANTTVGDKRGGKGSGRGIWPGVGSEPGGGGWRKEGGGAEGEYRSLFDNLDRNCSTAA